MRKTVSTTLLILVVTAISMSTLNTLPVQSKPKVPFFDNFNSKVLSSRWTIVDPDGGSTFDLTAHRGWLRITTTSPPGRDLIGTSFVNAPRIVQSVSSDFTIKTKVSSVMDENDEGAGIVVWKDSSNYLRLERMSRTIGYSVEPQIVFIGTINGAWSMPSPQQSSPGGIIHLPSNSNPTYLKLTRSGNIFSGYYSTDGINWNHVADIVLAVNDPVHVGLDIINVYHSGTFFADFDYFNRTAKK